MVLERNNGKLMMVSGQVEQFEFEFSKAVRLQIKTEDGRCFVGGLLSLLACWRRFDLEGKRTDAVAVFR
jgi:hypothetical protein